MKRWILDALVGIISLVILNILILFLPGFLNAQTAYMVALLLFVITICVGGFLIRNVST